MSDIARLRDQLASDLSPSAPSPASSRRVWIAVAALALAGGAVMLTRAPRVARVDDEDEDPLFQAF